MPRFVNCNAEVPTIIEITSQPVDSKDYYDDYTDDEDESQTEVDHDHDHNGNGQQHDDKYNVSRQDLDALKSMVREMMANPDLLYKSPVYSRVAAKSTSNRITPIDFALSPAPLALEPTVPSSFTTSGIRLTLPQDIPNDFCRECFDDNALLSLRSFDENHQSTLIQEIPTLPFSAER